MQVAIIDPTARARVRAWLDVGAGGGVMGFFGNGYLFWRPTYSLSAVVTPGARNVPYRATGVARDRLFKIQADLVFIEQRISAADFDNARSNFSVDREMLLRLKLVYDFGNR